MEVGCHRSLAELGRAEPSSPSPPSPDFKITTLPETEMVCNGCERSEFARNILQHPTCHDLGLEHLKEPFISFQWPSTARTILPSERHSGRPVAVGRAHPER